MKEYDGFDTLAFLPVSREDMESRGWWWYDFLIVTGDAYVDHPSFGPTVIARVLEAEGFRVAILSQPDWHSARSLQGHGPPPPGGDDRLREPGLHGGPLQPPQRSGAARTSTPPAKRRGCARTGR